DGDGVRGVNDASDHEARGQLMWAATLAGIAFGNAGCHAPHGMSYSVSGMVRDFHPDGYPPTGPIVPHGMSVIVNAPSVFRFTAPACPERHLEAAALLGADTRGATLEDAGEVVAGALIALMKATGMPNGITGVGYGEADIPDLTEGSFPQRRLLDNAPRPIGREELTALYKGALAYW
ncbi:MAG: iron-containing alcohol dehydrogenase, partial [Alphaproteobacteria bacterium]